MNSNAAIRTILGVENNFDKIRLMNSYELKSFIRDNRSIQVKIMAGNYNEDERIKSSQVIYAKNLLRLK
mgnify:FL=1